MAAPPSGTKLQYSIFSSFLEENYFGNHRENPQMKLLLKNPHDIYMFWVFFNL